MCLENIEEVSIEKVEAWKIFSFNNAYLIDKKNDYQLESAFSSAAFFSSMNLSYTLNRKIHVIPKDNTFFAFEKFEDACQVISEPGTWAFSGYNLIVLPVILYNVVRKGLLIPLLSSGEYPAFESKEIIVYDMNDTRKDVYHNFPLKVKKLFQKTYGIQLQTKSKKRGTKCLTN